MPNIPFEDLMLRAQQESYRMRHYYIGVEHLLVALLEIRGGITRTLLEDNGLSPDYVINAIRLKMSKGSKTNAWPSMPETPRARRVLDRVKQAMNTSGAVSLSASTVDDVQEVDERDVLISILQETKSLTVTVLEQLGLDVIKAIETARSMAHMSETVRTLARIEYADDYPDSLKPNQEHLSVLRRMFPGYGSIRIERRLMGGYTRALLVVVTPIKVGNIHDAPVVVKIDKIDNILDEAQRFEQHVKYTLPPMTARLMDRPTTPENSQYAGIKYTLIAAPDMPPRDLRSIIHEWSSEQLGLWLKDTLYPTFGRFWWDQTREYRFTAWREYDWLLPPILTLEFIPGSEVPDTAFTLRFPIKRGRLNNVDVGAVVIVENFTIRKIDAERKTLQLAIGLNTTSEMAYKVEIRGLDLTEDTFYRGEVLERIAGRVVRTRHEELTVSTRALQPDFDITQDYIPASSDLSRKVPNPLSNYENELERLVNGLISRIHGDLHLGNVMIGPHNSAFLIDFAKAREGHTLFDWASLEISILSDSVMLQAGESWEDARRVVDYLHLLNNGQTLPDDGSEISKALAAVVQVRELARDSLASPDRWVEYYVSLAFSGLRAITWEYMTAPARRLMFLVSGLAFHELRFRIDPSGGDDITRSPDETDLHSTM